MRGAWRKVVVVDGWWVVGGGWWLMVDGERGGAGDGAGVGLPDSGPTLGPGSASPPRAELDLPTPHLGQLDQSARGIEGDQLRLL